MSLHDLPKDQAVLLVRAMRWALAEGWHLRQAGWVSPDQLTAVEVDRFGDGGVSVWRRSSPDALWSYLNGPWRDLAVRSVGEGVDWLVLCGLLPARFSSTYAAGEESGRDMVTNAVMSGFVTPMLAMWWGDLNAEQADEPFGRGQQNGHLWAMREAIDAVCTTIGVAEPLWDDMEQIVLQPKVADLLASLAARRAVDRVDA